MPDDPIPDDVRNFILKHIDSIAHLEALLLLRRETAAGWTAPGAAKHLYIKENEAAELLARLAADGFLAASDGVYGYAGGSEEQRRVTSRLADIYARHLVPVTNLIHSKPRRIREFAAAFKLTKDN